MFVELSHFALIVELGSFTAAAKAAGITQPALSSSIQRLESKMNARLLDRGRHGATLTAAGEALLPRARAALAAVADGERAVAEVMGLRSGEVRLGGGPTACTWHLPAQLARFRQLYPQIMLKLHEDHSPKLRSLVREGSLDLAVVTGAGADDWGCDELVLVGPRGHALCGLSPQEVLRRVGESDFIAFSAHSPTRLALEELLPQVRIVMALSSIGAVVGNVRAGIGAALVPRAAVEEDLALGRLCLIDHPRTPLRRHLSLIHRGEEALTPAAAALRGLLLQHPIGEKSAAGPEELAPRGGDFA